eukprot:CAMPEP_0116881212 /NCGR_PEP_ID=MMETSP0463-20121206/13313_1 /TAXON_ID=181622 /ORGANISM="Strombidinopsis sp, Strain SopsisLIS2011" /LENGTH=75 /DNA_ID=CAMNT_0004532909 /DNA_START=160 /DNA_END=387 /DNA_ORIENTATION=+
MSCQVHRFELVLLGDDSLTEALDLGVFDQDFCQKKVKTSCISLNWIIQHIDIYQKRELEQLDNDIDRAKFIATKV